MPSGVIWRGTLVAVTAVRGATAKLPCRISSDNPTEAVLLVLWLQECLLTPVYHYDSRGEDGKASVGGRAHQWGDEEAWGAEQRAWFDSSHAPAHLLVREVRGRDEGNYTCKVHFRASPSWSQRVTLTVRDPPGFPRIQDGSGQRLEGPIGPYEDGTTVTMMCLTSGEPRPGLVWGGSGRAQARVSEEAKEGEAARTRLTIVASRATADATLACSTTNASVSSGIMNTVATTLKVNLAPLTVQLEALEAPGGWVSAGQQTSFRCRVVGSSPPPIVQWWLGGRRLTSYAPLQSVGGNVSVSTVRLTPQPGDDGVALVCKAFSPNLPGSVLQDQLPLAVHCEHRQGGSLMPPCPSLPFTLTRMSCRASPSFVPVAVVGVRGAGQGEAATVREGSGVTLTCEVEANPAVYNVTWFHNVTGPVSPRQGRALRGWAWGVEVDNATLRLPNVTAGARGLYTCVAANAEGDGMSNALNLNVEFAPVCAGQQRRHYLVAPGGSVTVSCQVQAYPTATTFTWALNNDSERSPVRLHSVGREEGLTGRYTLRGVKQKSVEVLCWARNAAGMQATPCTLVVYTQGRPGPVRNCSVASHTASGFRVACEAGRPPGTHTRYALLSFGGSKFLISMIGTPSLRESLWGRVPGGSNEFKNSESRRVSSNDVQGGGDLGKSEGRGEHSMGGTRLALGTLMRNLTSASPLFLVSGLKAGREFALVLWAAGDEGVSPPVVLTAFTLTDNAQTVIGE
ncbi:Neuronal growth regulator 1 [Chionoecetes opilio]|uniref:Neuronal growth regulator 1 n=1 Tax=Chionoecetes opilio TaxID=41210 RepID=A0A8J5CE76_CHIOP|nr:Neuronal growth regulator 1 [Chionoecetes opilio]